MDLLNQLFSVYKQANKIKFKELKMSNQTAKFGDIIEIYINKRLLIAAAVSSNEALLMSEFTEFATHTDLIVQMEHPIASRWIIETDKRLYLTPQMKYNTCCRLNENDIDILKSIIEGKSIPTEKSGPKIPPNMKDPRNRFKLEELKKTMLVNKHLFYEEET